jgi:hypothetical protein
MMALFMPAMSAAQIPEVTWDSFDAHIAPADNEYIDYALPFNFPFDGRIITAISVNTNGRIELLENGEACTAPCTEPGTHSIGVPQGMDAIFLANDDHTTGVVINGFSDKVIISYTGSTTVDNNFYDDTVQMQVIMFSDGRIRWNIYSMYYTSFSYDLFSGIHFAGGTELAAPIFDGNNDGITDYWPGFDLYDSYEYNGTNILRVTADLYDAYILLFDDAYLEFFDSGDGSLVFPFPFPFSGRTISGVAVNTNGLIELLEAGEHAQEYRDIETVDEFGNCSPGPDGVPDDWSCYGFNLYWGAPGTHALENHIAKNIDSVFLANDDLITGAMINGDANRVVITLSGITYEKKTNFVGKPLQMQVILFANGGILWNFFTMEHTTFSNDLYSGLYDELANTDTSIAGGTPAGADVMRAYEHAPCIQNDTTCDGIDDDCDGQFDEDYVPQSTNCGTGVCASTGVTSCVGGIAEDSCTPGSPTENPEVSCNDGLDNDCDGLTDSPADPDCVVPESDCFDSIDNDNDGLTDCADSDCDGSVGAPTTCGLGECSGNTGNIVCQSGSEVDTCDPLAGASAEICDNLDNDCDGTVDGITQGTTCGVGECAGNTGVDTCTAGTWGGDTCDPLAGATTEVCDGTLDEDCDG